MKLSSLKHWPFNKNDVYKIFLKIVKSLKSKIKNLNLSCYMNSLQK